MLTHFAPESGTPPRESPSLSIPTTSVRIRNTFSKAMYSEMLFPNMLIVFNPLVPDMASLQYYGKTDNQVSVFRRAQRLSLAASRRKGNIWIRIHLRKDFGQRNR